MAGYSGRLCQTCLPGFAKVGNKCERCPPYSVCVSVLVSGIFTGIVIAMVMVLAVVADAGSTSTASSLKRILLNHMQTIAMLLHFDLDWPPETTGFFSSMGAISSIGDDLIQTSCILGAQTNLSIRPFYVTQIGFILLPCIMLLPGTLFLCFQYGRPCQKKKNPTNLGITATQKRIAQLKHIREMQANASVEEESELRASYNHLLDELRTSGVEDVETASAFLADSSAIGRLRARDLMKHVQKNNVDLKDWFSHFDENNVGSIKVADFILIVKSMGLHWSEDDYTCVAALFGNRLANDRSGSGRVSLSKIMSFEKHYGDRWIVMLLTISYLLYPTITRKIFTSLSCRSGLMEGDSESYLWDDLEISCASVGHISFIIFIGLPGLFLYVCGFPLISLYSLRQRLKKYGWTNDTTMFRYAVIISGYTHQHWYWEIIICARKVLLTMTAVFLKNYGPERQFIFANLVLMVAMMFQVRERPFSNNELNNLENWSLGILFVSLYLGLFFFWDLVQGTGRTLMGIFIIGVNVLYMLWLSGSLFREYIARHHSRGTEWLSRNCHTKNPIILCMLSVPCFFILLFITMFHGAIYIVTCGDRFGPWATKKKKELPPSQVIPKNLLKRQRMNLREAIHIHVQHARVKLKSMKQLEMAKQTRNLHRVKSSRAHSRSASRLENRLASRNKEAAARFRMTKSETRRKLFDEQLLKDSENMETIGLLERVQSTNTISPKKSSMRNIATKVTAHNNAKKLINSHRETSLKKKEKHDKSGKESSLRLMRRLSKRSMSTAHRFHLRKLVTAAREEAK
jgi:hypothetical protein